MNELLTLSELQLLIRDSLYLSLPDMYWVKAEISEIKENYNGHCYLELVEKNSGDINIKARLRAVIWSNRYRFIKTFFENSAGESIKAGMKILVKVRIEYHEIYGLSLAINDIDPAFTIGEMAMKRQQILKKLEDEGVLNMNKELEFPYVPQRIAVVSSRSAAGYTDFMKHLSENNNGYVFYSYLFEAPLQGSETESGIISALERIAGHIEKFDVVVIIRGGGSQTDLSWFDNYNIAYFITQFPIPVITGIGHEKDFSVTDIVAHRSLKTPTAVADFLVDCMINAENHILEIRNELTGISLKIFEQTKERIISAKVRLIPMARLMISGFREELSATLVDMISTGKEYVHRAKLIPESRKARLASGTKSLLNSRSNMISGFSQSIGKNSKSFILTCDNTLNGFENSLKILNPVNVLNRGYTITSMNGKIIKDRYELKEEDQIETRFRDGSVKSRIL